MKMKRIYVGNLSFTTTADKVRELFAVHGDIESINLITDQVTGRPRGFAFVEMSSENAAAAIKALNGQELDGQNLRISVA
jgi:RNA recognition motif-containing protein